MKVYVLVYDGGFDFLYIGLFIRDVIIYLVILLRNVYFQQLDSSLYIAFFKKSCQIPAIYHSGMQLSMNASLLQTWTVKDVQTTLKKRSEKGERIKHELQR